MSTASVKVNALKGTQVFEPIKVGRNTLSNRIVFPPTTRLRSLDGNTPSDLNLKHYSDRTKYKGSLAIAEATVVGKIASGKGTTPGIYTDEHVKAWRKITDEVHKNGSFIGVQAAFGGRVASPAYLKSQGQSLVGPSAIYATPEQEQAAIEAGNPLKELSEQELYDLIHITYTNAAKRAIEAGFDYVELHGAHGFFLDQFLHESSNQRTDKYGGSIENRARFTLELVDHLSEVIGADRLAIRFSPWATSNSILGVNEAVHPITAFSYIISQLQKRAEKGKQLAYISVLEPRYNGGVDISPENQAGTNDFVAEIWKGVIIKAGNYTYDAPNFSTLLKDVSNNRTLVGFSRYFTSNPDLVQRLHDGADLVPYDRSKFYSSSNLGYNTYTAHGEKATFDEEAEAKRFAEALTV